MNYEELKGRQWELRAWSPRSKYPIWNRSYEIVADDGKREWDEISWNRRKKNILNLSDLNPAGSYSSTSG